MNRISKNCGTTTKGVNTCNRNTIRKSSTPEGKERNKSII
jgi:hypothetical protein